MLLLLLLLLPESCCCSSYCCCIAAAASLALMSAALSKRTKRQKSERCPHPPRPGSATLPALPQIQSTTDRPHPPPCSDVPSVLLVSLPSKTLLRLPCGLNFKKSLRAGSTLQPRVIFTSVLPAVAVSSTSNLITFELAMPLYLKLLREVRFPGSAERVICPLRFVCAHLFFLMKELLSFTQSQTKASLAILEILSLPRIKRGTLHQFPPKSNKIHFQKS